MDIEEVRIRKDALETRLLRLIDDFEAETKTKVSSVDYYSSKVKGISNCLEVTIKE